MERFNELARGASELHVQLKRGDIDVHAAEGADWTLEWSSDRHDEPRIERHGTVLRVSEHHGGGHRVSVRITMPLGVEAVDLKTGHGRIGADGLRAKLRLNSGNGALTLRSSGSEAEVSTGNGDVSIETFRGLVEAYTGNGVTRLSGLDGRARLKTGNGRIEVRDGNGQVQAFTGNGDVEVAATGGMVEVETGHGQIEIAAARSLAVRAKSGAGSIRVEGGTLHSARLETMMGEVTCAAGLAPGEYDLSSAMGAVTLALPAGARARVDAQTGFGHVRSDFPLVRVGRTGPMGFGGERMVGSIGEGAPEIEVSMRSGHGQLHIKQAGEREHPRDAGTPSASAEHPAAPSNGPAAEPAWQATVATATAERPSRADSTLAILEALARGDVSAAEAEDLLSQRGWQ